MFLTVAEGDGEGDHPEPQAEDGGGAARSTSRIAWRIGLAPLARSTAAVALCAPAEMTREIQRVIKVDQLKVPADRPSTMHPSP